MKKTKLTRSLLAACSIVALSAVMYGCVHNGGDDAPATDMSETPEPMPEPMPDPGPTDLEDTQTAAADAAAAAMTASDAAAKAADDAATATMYLATLQTGDDSNSDAMGGREAATAASEAAEHAAAAASEAADASAAAAAATTGDDGEAAWRMAVAAQEAAEAAQMDAETASAAAVEAAMTELHINGTVKTVGESSIDADMGKLTKTADDGSKTYTGFQGDVERTAGEVKGQAFVHGEDPADDEDYKQAVAARGLAIGKTLDTTDDMARVTVIHSRVGSKSVRVYAEIPDGADIDNIDTEAVDDLTGSVGKDGRVRIDAGTDDPADDDFVTLTPLGLYYKATDAVDDLATDVDETLDALPNELDHTDEVMVRPTTKGQMVYSYPNPSEAVGVDPILYVVRTSTTEDADGKITEAVHKHVDVTALAGPDIARDEGIVPDEDDLGINVAGDHEQVQVKASIPMAVKYDHIHFGVWASLKDNEDGDNSEIAGLGIGFVQSIGDGETTGLGIGKAEYNGNWVAVVQTQTSATNKDAFNLDDGAATMTADFDKDEFEADLKGLATLEGTLDGDGFSGVTAKGITHADLDSNGTFAGEFSGNIYGDKGEEAAGVFDFAGGEAGSFRGAFGGTNQE